MRRGINAMTDGLNLPIGVHVSIFANYGKDGEAYEVLPAFWTDIWTIAGATLIRGCYGIGSDHITARHTHHKSA